MKNGFASFILIITILTIASCYSIALPDYSIDALMEATRLSEMAFISKLDAREARILAIANSKELEFTRKAVELKSSLWLSSFRDCLPQIKLSWGKDERLSFTGPDSFTDYISVNISQPLWDGGRAGSSRIVEKAELILSTENLERLESAIGEKGVTAFNNLFALKLRKSLEEKARDLALSEFSLMQRKHELGHITGADLKQAEIRLAALETGIQATEIELEEMEAMFLLVLGIAVMPEISEDFDPYKKAMIIEKEAFIEEVIIRSPEIRNACIALFIMEETERAEKFIWLPNIRLDGGFTARGNSYPLRTASWNMGINISFNHPLLGASMNLSGGGSTGDEKNSSSGVSFDPAPDPSGLYRLENTKLTLLQEKEKFRMTVLNLRENAELQLSRYYLAEKRRDIAQKNLEISNESLELAKLRQSLGLALPNEVFDAGLDVNQKELELLDRIVEFLAAERELERLLDLEPGALLTLFQGG